MVDPGFDFTRQGIGADPLPAIDFSAGFKYLQNQQQLAIEQSRALMAQQGKMAELAVESETNQIRRAELLDKALARQHEEKLLDLRLKDNEKARVLARESLRSKEELTKYRFEYQEKIKTQQQAFDREMFAGREAMAKARQDLEYARLAHGKESREAKAAETRIRILDNQQKREFDRYVFEENQLLREANLDLEREQLALSKQRLEETRRNREARQEELKATLALRKEELEQDKKEAAQESDEKAKRLELDIQRLEFEEKELTESIRQFNAKEERYKTQADLDRLNYELNRDELRLKEVVELSQLEGGSADEGVVKLNALSTALDSGDIAGALKSLGTLKNSKGVSQTYLLPLFEQTGNLVKASELLDKDSTNQFSPEVKQAFGIYLNRKDSKTAEEFEDNTRSTINTSTEEMTYMRHADVMREDDQSVEEFAVSLIAGLSEGFVKEAEIVGQPETPLFYAGELSEAHTRWAKSMERLNELAETHTATSRSLDKLGEILFQNREMSASDQAFFSKAEGILKNIYDSIWKSAKTTEEKYGAFKMLAGKAGYGNFTVVKSWADQLLNAPEGERYEPEDLLAHVKDTRVLGNLMALGSYDAGLNQQQINMFANENTLTNINSILFEQSDGRLFTSHEVKIQVGTETKNEVINYLKDPEIKEFIAEHKDRNISDDQVALGLVSSFEFFDQRGKPPINSNISGPLLVMRDREQRGSGTQDQLDMVEHYRQEIMRLSKGLSGGGGIEEDLYGNYRWSIIGDTLQGLLMDTEEEVVDSVSIKLDDISDPDIDG